MILLMLGVFLGNWLIVPLFRRSKQHKSFYPSTGHLRADHTRGFFVGLIAAGIIFLVYWFAGWRML